MMARKVMTGASGIPITSPNHESLSVWYTMDDISAATLFDESANSNDGTITGAVAVAGKIGNALSFVDNSDFVVGTTSTIQSTNLVSVSCWIKLNALSDFVPILARYTEGSINKGIGLVVNAAGQLVVQGRADVTTYRYNRTSASTITTGVWIHIAVVFEPNEVYTVYIDNTLSSTTNWLSSGALTAFAYDATEPFKIGVNAGLAGDLNGLVDQLRVFDQYKFTVDDVSEFYNGGTGA